MEKNFGKLEEIIKDDDKIATVASFACEAHISIAESKEIFEKYVEINKGSKEINITHILNGKKNGENHISVSLVKDDNLKGEKELYQEGVNQIIFSIQKAKYLDFNVIALVNPVENKVEKDPISGSIMGENCIQRTLRKKVLPTLPPATIKGKSTIFTKQNSSVKPEGVKVEKSVEDSNKNNKNKANTQGNITNLFSKAAQNKKPEQKDLKTPEKKQKTNGFANFFTKQSSKESQNNEVKKEKQEHKEIQSELKSADDTDDEILKDLEINEEKSTQKVKKEPITTESKKQQKKSELFDSDTDDEIIKDLEIKDEKPVEKKREKKQEVVQKKNKTNSSQKKKRAVNDVGNAKSAKKRKRIIVEDDSDSDDIFGSEKSDSENVIDSSEEPEPITKEKKPLPPKNKRRKAVDKIYEDEEGYIVTKTEYVYETPSEDENEPENKIAKVEEKPKPKIEKKGSSNSENDISPKKGAKSKKGGNKKTPSGNQPTLMNFFKKK